MSRVGDNVIAISIRHIPCTDVICSWQLQDLHCMSFLLSVSLTTPLFSSKVNRLIKKKCHQNNRVHEQGKSLTQTWYWQPWQGCQLLWQQPSVTSCMFKATSRQLPLAKKVHKGQRSQPLVDPILFNRLQNLLVKVMITNPFCDCLVIQLLVQCTCICKKKKEIGELNNHNKFW